MQKGKITPKKPTGFIEFLPADQMVFNEMLEKIKSKFELFGFAPIDTPIVENSEIINAKTGGETDRQIFNFTKGDNELALRVDLTIPLARFVAEHYSKLTFPFRRYQVGKIFRGEKPQKGRFREFYQCDIDIIGNKTLDLINDAEIPSIINDILTSLNIGKFQIKISNRKILAGYIDYLGLANLAPVIFRTVDKIYKIGKDEVFNELVDVKIPMEDANKILDLITMQGKSGQKIEKLKNMIEVQNSIFRLGVSELSIVAEYIRYFGVPENNWSIDLSIVRGLEYYTGTVYETFILDKLNWGSICSGGRYENLAEFYSEQKLPGVGISIGLTRLFTLLKENEYIKPTKDTTSQVLIIPLSTDVKPCLETASTFREENIPTEIYTDTSADLRKKLGYANSLRIPFVVLIGDDEIKNNFLTLKNMTSGEQRNCSIQEAISIIQQG